MRILSIAYPLAVVAASTAGGAEQVLRLLEQELIRSGHESAVVAPAGSTVAGELFSVALEPPPYDSAAKARAVERQRIAIANAVEAFRPDVIHTHDFYFAESLPPVDVPVLATLHLPPEWYPPPAFESEARLNCVSSAQRARCVRDERIVGVVQNGVDTDALYPEGEADDYLAMLARICPEKGIDVALDVARRTGDRLLVAGYAYEYPEHRRYFESEIVPRMDGRRRVVGAISGEEKRTFLAKARALLVPSRADETSSLAAMEALACGTPVIVFDRGALPEIVEHGVTGFIVKDADGMVEAITRVGEIDRQMCRRRAMERFSARRMTVEYVALYRQLKG